VLCPADKKSLLLNSCWHSSGGTSVTFGLLRHHGGEIAERNRWRSPRELSDPAVTHPQHPDLDGARDRGDLPRLGVAVGHHQPMALLVLLGRVAAR
jgi:hypothetical protein